MGKLLILADEHAQLFVIDADVAFHHFFRSAATLDIVVDEVEYHIRVIHRSLTIAFLGKTVVVVPGLHHLYQFVHGMTERTVR